MDIVWDGIKRTETLNESAADACSALADADADADADAAKAYDCLHFQPFNFFSGDRRGITLVRGHLKPAPDHILILRSDASGPQIQRIAYVPNFCSGDNPQTGSGQSTQNHVLYFVR